MKLDPKKSKIGLNTWVCGGIGITFSDDRACVIEEHLCSGASLSAPLFLGSHGKQSLACRQFITRSTW